MRIPINCPGCGVNDAVDRGNMTENLCDACYFAPTPLEVELGPDELNAYQARILSSHYTIRDIEATAASVRLALRFAQLMAESGFRGVKFVPSEHIGGCSKQLAMIFEGGGEIADEIQFSDDWHAVEDAHDGWYVASINCWSASVSHL